MTTVGNSRVTPLIILLIATGFSLLLVEVVVRITESLKADKGIRQSSSYIKSDNGTIYTLRPNIVTKNSLAKTNSLSIRAREPNEIQDSHHRILVLGDSVTFAGELPLNLIFTNILERRINQSSAEHPLSVINAGIPGYTPYNERMMYRSLRGPYQPDVVILQLCLNDIVDPWLHWNQFIYGGISSSEIPQEAIPDVPYHKKLRYLFLFRSVFELRARIYQLWSLAVKPSILLSAEDVLDTETYGDSHGSRLEWLGRQIKLLHTDTLTDAVPLLVLLVPLKPQLGLTADELVPQKSIGRLVRSMGIPFVDTTTILSNANREINGSVTDVFVDQWHLAPKGHELVASALYDGLRAHVPDLIHGISE